MEEQVDIKQLKANFAAYLLETGLKNLTLILSMALLVLAFYFYSDWFVRQSEAAAYARLVAMGIILLLLIPHLIFPHNFLRYKKVLMVLVYLVLQLMMYTIAIVHLHDEALAPSITGVILVSFLISLDIKFNHRVTTFIYLLPIIAFTLTILFIEPASKKEFVVLADIYPILMVGFMINRLQYKLRYRLFKSNYLLALEKEKTSSLFETTLNINLALEKKADEALHKQQIIEKQNAALHKSNAMKDRFMGIIAHDLKNSIGGILGFSEVILKDERKDWKATQSNVKIIRDSARNTYELMEKLLKWAMAQKKEIQFHPASLSVNQVLQHDLQSLKQMAGKKSLHLQHHIPDTLQVYADENMLCTAVRNIVSNAIKYSHAQGRIEVEASLQQEGKKSYTQISVRDSGVGMTAKQLQSLFQIDQHVSTKGTEDESGTGLGLLLCKEFMDVHQGQIKVESHAGEGTTFHLCFPGIV